MVSLRRSPELLPVVNKIDMASADPERALEQMRSSFELDTSKAVLVSAKTGRNVEAVLPAVIEHAPPYGYPFFLPSFFLHSPPSLLFTPTMAPKAWF